MPHKPFKAVIPAAGLGTRFLPATKAMPKEMLPVVDKPAIQYVVEEAAQAGIDDILVIIGRNKNAISNHFDSVPELEEKLKDKGDDERLRRVMAVERPRRHPLRAPGRAQGPRPRRAARQGARRRPPVRGAARRRPDRRARPAADDDARRARAHRRDDHRPHGGRPRPHPPVRRRRRRGDRRPTASSRSPGSSRSPSPRTRRRTSPSSAATC